MISRKVVTALSQEISSFAIVFKIAGSEDYYFTTKLKCIMCLFITVYYNMNKDGCTAAVKLKIQEALALFVIDLS